jgi:5-formyltetrahydrofolate cyclo-ligase
MLEIADLKIQKRALRERMLVQRGALAPARRDAASAAITQSLLMQPAYAKANVVLAYASFGDEFDTAAFLQHILFSKKILVLPRVDKATQQLVLHRVLRIDELVAGVWGIREPRADAPQVTCADVDFALIPGLAFDRRGGRLGYGGGYYDKLLSIVSMPQTRLLARSLGQSKAMGLCAGAFSCQIVDQVPLDQHDIRIPLLITENEIISTHDC